MSKLFAALLIMLERSTII